MPGDTLGSGTLAFIPGEKFVSVSITGLRCGLNCTFCRGKFLRSMVLSESPQELRDLLHYYYSKGTRGFLISGGFNREGFLPITGEYLGILREFKRGRPVFLSIHLGLAPKDIADKVLEVFDLVDYEVPPSDGYVKYGRGISASLKNYIEALRHLIQEHGKDRVAPHIVIGSQLASPQQELAVVDEVSRVYRGIVVLLLHASTDTAEEDRVLEVARFSKKLFEEVSLGCLRPRKQTELVNKLISMGYVDRVVNPGIDTVKKHRMRVIGSCCSIPRSAFDLFE